MRSTLAAVVVLMAWPAMAQTVVDGSGGRMPPRLQSAMMTSLQSYLRDAGSAKIRGMHPAPVNGLWCGEINAPNASGGMTGFQLLMFNPKNGAITLSEEAAGLPAMEAAFHQMCGQ